MSTTLTLSQFQQVLPVQAKKSMNQALVDQLNTTLTSIGSDPVFMENYRDNLLGFSSVMKDGKFKMESYIDSVRYVSYKLLGDSNINAYTKTFPNRIHQFNVTGTSDKDIASYVCAYNKNKLVNLVWEQSSIPFHVYNQDTRQRALDKLVQIMVDPKVSPKVQSDSANAVLTHLKGPEKTQIELDIGITADTKSIDSLTATISALTEITRQNIEDGHMTAQEAAHSKLIIEGEIEDAEIVENVL